MNKPLASEFGFGGLSGGSELIMNSEASISLLYSRLIWEKALLAEVLIKQKQMRLINFYLQKEDPQATYFPEGLTRDLFSRQQDSLLNHLRIQISNKRFTITEPVTKSNFRTLQVQNENELFAKLLADQLLAEMALFYISLKTQTTRNNLLFLETSADSMAIAYQQSLQAHAYLGLVQK